MIKEPKLKLLDLAKPESPTLEHQLIRHMIDAMGCGMEIRDRLIQHISKLQIEMASLQEALWRERETGSMNIDIYKLAEKVDESLTTMGVIHQINHLLHLIKNGSLEERKIAWEDITQFCAKLIIIKKDQGGVPHE